MKWASVLSLVLILLFHIYSYSLSDWIAISSLLFIKAFFFWQQARAEQEEEYISNTLLKKIQALKKEKETLALNYEQEEECLTNDLSRKLSQVHISFK